jgi:hypothetical protein
MPKAWKETAKLVALGLGVSVIGLVGGALLMSPAVTPAQRLVAFVALGGAAGLALVVELGRRAWTALRVRGGRRSRPASVTAPTMTLRSGKASRTPRTVQALAAAGAAPTEIAWKTGLPLDAVSMLLDIHGARLASR